MLLLIIVLILLFGVGGFGYRGGYVGPGGTHNGLGSGLGLILIIVVLFLLFGGLGGGYGWHRF